MTHVTCRLTANNLISCGTLRSVIEYGYLHLFRLQIILMDDCRCQSTPAAALTQRARDVIIFDVTSSDVFVRLARCVDRRRVLSAGLDTTLSVINRTVLGRTKLTVLTTLDGRFITLIVRCT